MSERKKHIAVLKEMLEWMNMSSEVIKKDDPFFRVNEHRKKAVKYAIASLETDEAYQLEYELTTKNNLGVDCISRQEVLRLLASSIGKSNTYLQTKVLRMSSVTPIRPKGHWIPTYGNVKCSACGHTEEARGVGKATHYCSFCGADMREVVEE